ncbi:MAG: hypothetical protein DRP95_01015, partial [Candidatus Latescibacterota bacterium]
MLGSNRIVSATPVPTAPDTRASSPPVGEASPLENSMASLSVTKLSPDVPGSAVLLTVIVPPHVEMFTTAVVKTAPRNRTIYLL